MSHKSFPIGECRLHKSANSVSCLPGPATLEAPCTTSPDKIVAQPWHTVFPHTWHDMRPNCQHVLGCILCYRDSDQLAKRARSMAPGDTAMFRFWLAAERKTKSGAISCTPNVSPRFGLLQYSAVRHTYKITCIPVTVRCFRIRRLCTCATGPRKSPVGCCWDVGRKQHVSFG